MEEAFQRIQIKLIQKTYTSLWNYELYYNNANKNHMIYLYSKHYKKL